jgi:hypothetical protein
MIKRWMKNIKWLFNHPPTGIVEGSKDVPCDYCGCFNHDLWHHINYYCICESCRKKVFDSVLKPKST